MSGIVVIWNGSHPVYRMSGMGVIRYGSRPVWESSRMGVVRYGSCPVWESYNIMLCPVWGIGVYQTSGMGGLTVINNFRIHNVCCVKLKYVLLHNVVQAPNTDRFSYKNWFDEIFPTTWPFVRQSFRRQRFRWHDGFDDKPGCATIFPTTSLFVRQFIQWQVCLCNSFSATGRLCDNG